MIAPTFRTVLRPDFPSTHHREYRTPRKEDYILVPRVLTIGHFLVRDMLPIEQLAKLAAFTNELEVARKSKVRLGY